MSRESGLTISVAPGSMLLSAAAKAIIAGNCDCLPNLADVVVLLPNLYLTTPLQQALHRAADGRALLLPRMTTLNLWAQSVTIEPHIVPESRRLAWIYNALRLSDFFAGMNRWQVATELLTLINECDRQSVALPQDEADFLRVVSEAVRATDNHAIQFEARLVHELWRALQLSSSDGIDAYGAYMLRLGKIATQATAPLYVVGLLETTPAEQQFFSAYAQRQPVHVVRADAGLSANSEPLFALLHSAWATAEPDQGPPHLMERATQLRKRHSVSPAEACLSIFPARSLEQEAQAVEVTVRRWLHEGKCSIAIIAQDRLTARRARARLERSQVLIADESGWTLSTTTASSVVMRWLTLIAGDFYFRDLFDFLRSPFIFSNLTTADRESAILEMDHVLRNAKYVMGLNRLRQLIDRTDLQISTRSIAQTLAEAAIMFAGKAKPFSIWLTNLLRSLEQLGATAMLEQDAAGRDLLSLLQTLMAELKSETAVYSLGEWRRWLDQQLEQASFRDRAIQSPVVLTHLGLTDGRHFDAVILLGADADHLPSAPGNTLFNDAVLQQLGLPDRAKKRELELQRLIQALANAGEVLVTWQAEKAGEKNAPSPYWLRLQALHRLAYGSEIANSKLGELLHGLNIVTVADKSAVVHGSTQPQPRAAKLLRDSLSASGYSSLLACPYQFYARHMLGLREEQDVVEELEKKDYGDLVHRVLAQFHQRFPVLAQQDELSIIEALHEISNAVFSTAPQTDYFARAWLLRWQKLVPAYITWQRDREEKGWRWQVSEVSLEQALPFATGRSIQLKGRLDRIDQNDESFALLDYKTANVSQLQRRVADSSEDAQLAFYAILADQPVVELAYVGLDQDPIKTHAIKGDAGGIAATHRRRLQETLSAIAANAALPAQGVDGVCQYCEAQGICRKRYWRDER